MPINDELNEDKKQQKHCYTTTSNSTKLALNKRRRSSISSIFELHIMSQLDLNIFKINYDQKQKNKQERRKSLGLLTSKDMINQIKNMNSLEQNQNIESKTCFFL